MPSQLNPLISLKVIIYIDLSISDLIKSVGEAKAGLLHDWKSDSLKGSMKLSEIKGSETEVSKFVQAIEDYHSKILSDISSIEDSLKKKADSVQLINKELHLQQENFKMKEFSMNNEIETLTKQVKQLTQNNQIDEARYNKKLEDSITQLKIEHSQEMEKQESNYQSNLKEINETNERTIISLQEKASELILLEKEKAQLTNECNKLNQNMQLLCDKIFPLYESISGSKDVEQIDECFMMELISKEFNRVSTEYKWMEGKQQAMQAEYEQLLKDHRNMEMQLKTICSANSSIKSDYDNPNGSTMLQKLEETCKEVMDEIEFQKLKSQEDDK